MKNAQSKCRTHITVCIITFRRPRRLARLLRRLQDQKMDNQFTFSVVVVDNDSLQSAKSVVEEVQESSMFMIHYDSEPERNLAVVRNRAVTRATGDFIAFIDDDEFPVDDWLLNLLETCRSCKADGVLGPVLPHFEHQPPRWIISSKICERPSHPTGHVLDWDETRTGNVLLRRNLFEQDEGENLFNPEFGIHGEDRDFFKRLMVKGYTFVWCEEAPVYETQSVSRFRRGYFMRRALLRGSISWRHASSRTGLLLSTIAAIFLYTLSLPFLLPVGQALFMRYLIKNCDHIGRLLAALGLKAEDYLRSA